MAPPVDVERPLCYEADLRVLFGIGELLLWRLFRGDGDCTELSKMRLPPVDLCVVGKLRCESGCLTVKFLMGSFRICL